MVRLASSLLGAAVVFSSLASAAPTKRQDITPVIPTAGEAAPAAGDITPVIPTAGEAAPASGDITPVVPVLDSGAGAAEGEPLSTIDLSGVPTGVQTSGSLGTLPSATSVEIPPVETTPVTPPPVEQPPVVQPPVESQPPVVIPPVVSSGGHNLPQYGSGSVPWGQSYDNCVQTCFASYPPPATTVTLPAVEQAPIHDGVQTTPAVGGSGNVWNIIVAPVKGVFRFMPPFVNAQAGDTIRYTWANGEHTVTQSSAAAPCNATVAGFVSGKQKAGFTFDQRVNDTNPVWFFCSVGQHCASGMWGGVNVPNGDVNSATTVAALMPQWAAASPDINAALTATNAKTADSPAKNWGNTVDLAGIDPAYHAGIAQSILYTRAVIAENKDMVGADGVFRPAKDVKLPADFAALLSTADQGGLPGSNTQNANVAQQTGTPNNNAAPVDDDAETYGSNGAGSLVSSRVAVAAVAVLAALFAF
ncbi:hypothetical protein AURDEDRAFT_117577 [Auricularia subglabra TFB-10046 SS5]|uniref:Phytocyanin domain-containing protein n=1 Tax=Auricularia subglabra (strain TFB-10046 / SS5) TaxID=717982 RepID=J0D6Z6_AURST|nr:hypothetical protein AURDEDRAFT_117577 [Auricularia subglabra TFB-10046 SS5]